MRQYVTGAELSLQEWGPPVETYAPAPRELLQPAARDAETGGEEMLNGASRLGIGDPMLDPRFSRRSSVLAPHSHAISSLAGTPAAAWRQRKRLTSRAILYNLHRWQRFSRDGSRVLRGHRSLFSPVRFPRSGHIHAVVHPLCP
jgi:hypothetical protein